MNTFLPKNQWMNFNCFKEKDFCIVNNLDRRLKDRLFYCFTQCFEKYYIDNFWETNDRKLRLDRALYELQYALINLKEQK